MLAIGSTNSQLSVVTLELETDGAGGKPRARDVLPPVEYEGEELYDCDFNDEGSLVRRCFFLSWPRPTFVPSRQK